jgi:hypothetical protein
MRKVVVVAAQDSDLTKINSYHAFTIRDVGKAAGNVYYYNTLELALKDGYHDIKGTRIIHFQKGAHLVRSAEPTNILYTLTKQGWV